MDSDSVLIRKMKRGEEQAIEEFVRKYYDRILQYFRFRIGTTGYAEDLTQETFEKFFRTFGEYKHYGKAINYLYVIAGNTCKDFYKREATRKDREILTEEWNDEALEKISNFSDANVEEQVIQSFSVTEALKVLPEEVSEVAILYFVQECSLKQIAEIMGIGLPLVKYRVRAAREKLKRILGEEDAL